LRCPHKVTVFRTTFQSFAHTSSAQTTHALAPTNNPPPEDNPALDLFGEPIAEALPKTRAVATVTPAAPPAKGRLGSVAPAPPSAEAVSAAAHLPANIRLGTSSWSFPGWAGLVFATTETESRLARDGLAAYAQHPLFRTVSIDRTFYAPLSETEFANYAKAVPDGFQFVVKAPMAVTSSYLRTETGGFADSPFYLDADYAINEFVAPCTLGLAAKAGPLVFQFPPQGRLVTANPDPFINRLYRFLCKLPPGLRYAVEVRDAALLTTRFFKCLETTGTNFCVASHAKMPSPADQIALLQTHLPMRDFVCRWSLHAGFQYEDAKSRYAPFNRLVDEDLGSRAALAIAAATAARAGYASFITINNKAEGSAPLSVLKLAQAITDAGGKV
jgi:uncharacterized protein YecE (DUF72 family)